MAVSAGAVYAQVTMVPPPNWELAPVIVNNVAISANASGQYVFLNISNSTVASFLSQGWNLVTVS